MARNCLAGSANALIDAVRYCVDTVGLELAESLRMASRYPAAILGLGCGGAARPIVSEPKAVGPEVGSTGGVVEQYHAAHHQPARRERAWHQRRGGLLAPIPAWLTP